MKLNSIVNLPVGLSEEEKKKFKRQYWYILIYEDSVDKEYVKKLTELQYRMAISPWHDRDISENGELVKKHKHILIDFGGSVGLNSVLAVCNSINAKTDVEWKGNKKLSFEYLYHKNNPEKAQYDYHDIIFINSKIYDWVSSAFKDILNYIDDEKILSFVKLTKCLRNDDRDELLEYVSKNSYYVNTYLKDLTEDATFKVQDTYNQVMKLIRDYEVYKIIKSEQIKAVQQSLDKLGLYFDIVDE